MNAPTPGLEGDQEAELRTEALASYWAATGLSKELRPPDFPPEVVTRAEWPDKYVACMNEAGFDNYTAVTDGYQRDGDLAESEAERVANFVCDASFTVPVEEYGYLNPAQRAYVYDYYAHVLVPCLQDRGVEPSDVPTREQFLGESWFWSPYDYVESNFQERPFSDKQLLRDCPTLPPGVFDDRRFE